jgi:hypothetical protein
MSYVLVCEERPLPGEPCPVEMQQYEYYAFTMTQKEFDLIWPTIIQILFIAYGFRVLLRQINNR